MTARSERRDPSTMTFDELVTEVLELRAAYDSTHALNCRMFDTQRSLRDEWIEQRHRIADLHADLRAMAKGQGVPFVMMKVRSWIPGAKWAPEIADVRYYGPSHGPDARRRARTLRQQGKCVQVMAAPLGRWVEVDW